MVIFHVGKIGFIGAGNIATALIRALVDHNYSDIVASRRNKEALEELSKIYGIETTNNNIDVVTNSDTIVLSVKPQVINDVLEEINNYITSDKLLISVVTGKTIEYLTEKLRSKRVVRCMPNIGSFVGHGSTAYTLGSGCSDKDRSIVEYIFSRGDDVLEVKEEAMNAVTYIACKIGLLSKELEQDEATLAEYGLESEKSRILIANALRATAAFIDRGESYDSLYRRVASPKGATETAEKYAREIGHYENLKNIASVALERCKELAK